MYLDIQELFVAKVGNGRVSSDRRRAMTRTIVGIANNLIQRSQEGWAPDAHEIKFDDLVTAVRQAFNAGRRWEQKESTKATGAP